jgi:hypothetical protein
MKAGGMIAVDGRSSCQLAPAWFVTFETPGGPAAVVAPGFSFQEAEANALELAIGHGWCSVAECSNVASEPLLVPMAEAVALVLATVAGGAMAIEVKEDGPGTSPAHRAGFVVPGPSTVQGLALVMLLGSALPAYAHHEIALVELASSAGFWVPVGVLAALGVVDRVRFWWRDGARVSVQVGRLSVYCSRGLSGEWFRFEISF